MGESSGRRAIVIGIVVPLGVVGLAYALWWISDQLLYIGPLDRATFGGWVVAPLWFAAPVVAGFTWRRLPVRDGVYAGLASAIAIGVPAAVLLWRSVQTPDCAYGQIHPPGESVVPSLIVGAAIGGSIAISGLLAAWLTRAGHPWRAIVAGVGLEIILTFATILFSYLSFFAFQGCNRPSG